MSLLYPIHAEKPDKKNETLTKIAILNFYDNTGSKYYSYLSESIADATDIYLKKNFKYKRISKKKVKAYLKRKYNVSKLSRVPEISYDGISQAAKKLGADIIIYGSYEINKESRKLELEFTSKIYFNFLFRYISIKTLETEISTKIFSKVKKSVKEIGLHIKEGFAFTALAEIVGIKRKTKGKTPLNLEEGAYSGLGLRVGYIYPVNILTEQVPDEGLLSQPSAGLNIELTYSYILAFFLPYFAHARYIGYFPDLHTSVVFERFSTAQSKTTRIAAMAGGIFSFNLPVDINSALKTAVLAGVSYNIIETAFEKKNGINPEVQLLFGYEYSYKRFTFSGWLKSSIVFAKNSTLVIPGISVGSGFRF